MKKILLSVHPKYCKLIFNSEKTIEVRKSAPKIDPPFEVLIYCTTPKERWSVGHQIFFNDTLYTLPTGELKLGDALELRADWLGKYDENNFLNGKVIGSFICDKIYSFITYGAGAACIDSNFNQIPTERVIKETCLTEQQLMDYFERGIGNYEGYGWYITEPKLFDKPKALSEFSVYGKCAEECSEYDICMKYDSVESRFECPDFSRMLLKRAPQSWCYVDD